MPTIETIRKYQIAVAVLGVIIIILAILLVMQDGHGTEPTAGTAANTPATSTTPSTGTVSGQASAPAKTSGGSRSATPKPVPYTSPESGFVVHLLTPISGETWTIAQQNLISWDHAAGVTGQIELLDTKTKALVGVILPQTGPQQTSYSWQTRFFLISRNSPTLNSVTPGTYLVRVAFDGNNLSPITSGPVTIGQ